MKLIKSKVFWIVVVGVIAVGSWLAFKPEPAPEYTTEEAERGMLTQTVSVTGAVQGASEISLNFETPGTIVSLLVNKGDQVEAGEKLAQLSAQNQYNSVAEAQANVQAARASLDKLIAGAGEQDIAVSKESVSNAEIAYENKVIDLENLKTKLITDEQQYRTAIASSQVSWENTRSATLSAISNDLFKGQAALNRISDIFDRDDAKDTLSAKKASAKVVAENSLQLGQQRLIEAQTNLTATQIDPVEAKVDIALTSAISAQLQIAQALADMYDVLVNTPSGSNYTTTEIEADKTNIKADQTTIAASITSLQNQRASWENAKTAIITANNNLSVFLANKDSQLAAAEGAVRTAKGAWDLTKAQYQQLVSPTRSEDIQLQRARLAQAQALLGRAQSTLDQFIIYAPVGGVITRSNYEVGEKTDLTKPVFSLLGESGLEIEVNIPESDIAKVEVGDKAHITLDAFGEDQVFAGHITYIDLAETLIQDVVYYKVKITFDEKQENIKPGMTANVDIVTAEKPDVLLIPARAVKENGEKYVELLVDTEVKKQEVKTGLRGDGGLVEITEGLEEGDVVITFIKEAN